MAEAVPLHADDPRQLGRYRLIGRLGEGGQGAVYLGEGDRGLLVAVKVLGASSIADTVARRRFSGEVALARQVSSFCIAEVLDADLDGPRPYIVSEFVDGPSLQASIAANGPRSGGSLRRLAVGTVTALAAIHQAGIVHRDFKPHNVVLGPDGPRVVDFGIARLVDSTVTVTSSVVGSVAYMSPEQVRGHDIGAATDLFSWAMTMSYAASGEPLFGRDSLPAVIARIMNDDPVLPEMPADLAAILTECLAKDASLRPTAGEVLMRLIGTDSPTGSPFPVSRSAPPAGSAPPASSAETRVAAQRAVPAPSAAQSSAPPVPSPSSAETRVDQRTVPAPSAAQSSAPPVPSSAETRVDQRTVPAPSAAPSSAPPAATRVDQGFVPAGQDARTVFHGSPGPVEHPSGPAQPPAPPPGPPPARPRRRLVALLAGAGALVVVLALVLVLRPWSGDSDGGATAFPPASESQPTRADVPVGTKIFSDTFTYHGQWDGYQFESAAPAERKVWRGLDLPHGVFTMVVDRAEVNNAALSPMPAKDSPEPVTDVVVDVTAVLHPGAKGPGDFGLVCRANEDVPNGFGILLGLDGRVLVTRTQQGNTMELSPSGKVTAPKAGKRLRIQALCRQAGEGTQVTVWIDGKQVVDVTDQTAFAVDPVSQVGLIMRTPESTPGDFTVSFDDFSVYQAG